MVCVCACVYGVVWWVTFVFKCVTSSKKVTSFSAARFSSRGDRSVPCPVLLLSSLHVFSGQIRCFCRRPDSSDRRRTLYQRVLTDATVLLRRCDTSVQSACDSTSGDVEPIASRLMSEMASDNARSSSTLQPCRPRKSSDTASGSFSDWH